MFRFVIFAHPCARRRHSDDTPFSIILYRCYLNYENLLQHTKHDLIHINLHLEFQHWVPTLTISDSLNTLFEQSQGTPCY